jgi:hypothetical protein
MKRRVINNEDKKALIAFHTYGVVNRYRVERLVEHGLMARRIEKTYGLQGNPNRVIYSVTQAGLSVIGNTSEPVTNHGLMCPVAETFLDPDMTETDFLSFCPWSDADKLQLYFGPELPARLIPQFVKDRYPDDPKWWRRWARSYIEVSEPGRWKNFETDRKKALTESEPPDIFKITSGTETSP